MCFCQINSKWFPKSSRDHLKIIYGSLVCFSTMSFNIWVVNLHYKILTWYQIYLRLSLKCWKNTKTKFLIWKKQKYVFLFLCIQPNSKHLNIFKHILYIKNKNHIFIILWKIQKSINECHKKFMIIHYDFVKISKTQQKSFYLINIWYINFTM